MGTERALDTAQKLAWRVDPGTAAYERLVRWLRLREEWLAAAKGPGRTTSPHTLRAYRTASDQWLDNLIAMPGGPVYPWDAGPEHVRVWQRFMGMCGRSETTINARLAAASSWYSFILADAPDEIERNPFVASTVRRARVRPYGRARPLGPDLLRRLFEYTGSRVHTVGGARNHALLLTAFLTGARASEVVSMRWDDIRPNRSQPDGWVWMWRGKGGKAEPVALPTRVIEAIDHYGVLAGAEPVPEWFIWQPLTTHGLANLGIVSREGGHISTQTANRVLRQSLRAAGIADWRRYRMHDLRHSFAHLHYQETHDLNSLRRLLHHGSLATTDIYVREMADPVDGYSETVWSALGLG